jgi:hypothetical protein
LKPLYLLRLAALVAASVVSPVLIGCSSGTATQQSPADEGASPTSDEAGSTDAGAKAAQDSSTPETKPDAAEAMPTKPLLDVTVNGVAMKVKDVAVVPKQVYPDQGISYYEITATLEQSPPIVQGLQKDPSITIRVGKDENGSDVCKEKRGPQVGFIQPVIELREVKIKYQRFTGAETVIATPSTKDGSCTMLLKSAASTGKAWGEASGSVQAGADEPVLTFQAKWFQELEWN